MIGMDFGKKASNLLLKGSSTSTSAMALGGAVAGGAYGGTIGDDGLVGGAMQGAMLGSGAKFASNMYAMGAARAAGRANLKGTSISEGLKLSNFTSGFEQAGRRGYMHSGFSQRPNVSMPSANTSAQGSMKATERSVPTPMSTSVPTNTKVEAPKGSAQGLREKEASIRTQRAEELTIPAQERAAARTEAYRRNNGANVGSEAVQRLAQARTGGIGTSVSDLGTTERYLQHPKGRQIDMFGGGGNRTPSTPKVQSTQTSNPRQYDLFGNTSTSSTSDFQAYNNAESSRGLF